MNGKDLSKHTMCELASVLRVVAAASTMELVLSSSTKLSVSLYAFFDFGARLAHLLPVRNLDGCPSPPLSCLTRRHTHVSFVPLYIWMRSPFMGWG